MARRRIIIIKSLRTTNNFNSRKDGWAGKRSRLGIRSLHAPSPIARWVLPYAKVYLNYINAATGDEVIFLSVFSLSVESLAFQEERIS